MSVERKTLSFPSDLWERVEERARSLGYTTVSAYFQHLLRQDLLIKGNHMRLEEPPAPPYKVNPDSAKDSAGINPAVIGAVDHLAKDVKRKHRSKRQPAAPRAKSA